MPIEGYLQGCLGPQLAALGVDPPASGIVVADVRGRLLAVLRHWKDVRFRRTILLPGLEEATYYEPLSAPLEVKALVVVAVRNSLIEDLGTERPFTRELVAPRPYLTDEQIPEITRAAIEYFQEVDLAGLDASGTPASRADPYEGLSEKYPRAWRAMAKLADPMLLEVRYQVMPGEPPALPSADDLIPRSPKGFDIRSGIDPRLTASMFETLSQVERQEIDIVFADSFKVVTRNPEKLHWVIEFVTGHGAALVTHNYYLAADYTARRRNLLRPVHVVPETRLKFRDQSGLRERHLQALVTTMRATPP